MEEIIGKVPTDIKIRDFDGRAMISIVDVKLKNMRPVVMPLCHFEYRHMAFRLLVDDSEHNDDNHAPYENEIRVPESHTPCKAWRRMSFLVPLRM